MRRSKHKPLRESFEDELKILEEQIDQKRQELEELQRMHVEFKKVIEALEKPQEEKTEEAGAQKPAAKKPRRS
jgi:prefoldin subunit 5